MIKTILLLVCIHSWIFPASPSPYQIFEHNGKFGIKNDKGNIIVPAHYEALGWSNQNKTIISNLIGYKNDGKWGLLSIDNKRITKPIYQEILPQGEIFLVRQYNPAKTKIYTGCITASGDYAVPLLYTDLIFNDLRIVACVQSHQGFLYGIISFSNKIILPLRYASIQPLGTFRYAVENADHRIALYSENGEALTDFVIDTIYPFKDKFALFEQDGALGLLDRQGTIVVSAQYRNIRILQDESIQLTHYNEWHRINKDNIQQQHIQADSIQKLVSGNYRIKKRNGFYLIDTNLKLMTGCYDTILETIRQDLLIVKNKKYGVIDVRGNTVIPCQYDSIVMDTKWIYTRDPIGWTICSHAGKPISESKYEEFQQEEYYTYLKKKGFWGAMHSETQSMIACVYDSITESNSTQLVVKFRGETGILSSSEEWLVPPKKSTFRLINKNYYLEQEGILLTLKNYSLHYPLYFTNNPITITADGLLEKTTHGELWQVSFSGVITKLQHNESINLSYIQEEKEGYRAIKKEGKWGFLDAQGRLRIPNRYDSVRYFSEGLASFQILSKWGFINKEDQIVIQPTFEKVTAFKNSLSIVNRRGLQGILHREGHLSLPCRYDSIKRLPDGYFELYKDGLLGLADDHGVLQYEPKYTWQKKVGTIILVGNNGKYGTIDSSGLSMIPMMYDAIIKTDDITFIVMTKGATGIFKP